MMKHDEALCTHCGVCLSYRGGYCLSSDPPSIRVEESLCNECGECAALCPSRAFRIEGSRCRPIRRELLPRPESLLELLMARRSIRHFKEERVDRALIARVVEAGRYAPTMNREIRAVVVDDPGLLREIEAVERRQYSAIYRVFFRSPWMRAFRGLFGRGFEVAGKKLEYSLRSGDFLYGAPALVLMAGDPKTVLTETSAQYHLFAMLLCASSLGLGACLMDSARTSLRMSASLRNRLGIPRGERVLGAMVLGHPEERVLNLVEGLSLGIGWNSYDGAAAGSE